MAATNSGITDPGTCCARQLAGNPSLAHTLCEALRMLGSEMGKSAATAISSSTLKILLPGVVVYVLLRGSRRNINGDILQCLKRLSSKRCEKCLPMNKRHHTVFPNGLPVDERPVPFVCLKTIHRMRLRKLFHMPITRHLRHNRGK